MKFWRKYHRLVGLVLGIILALFAVSGVLLNHRNWFSRIDISRKVLPSSYQYKNWNNAAIKGFVDLSPDSVLVYGNVGCWIWQPSTNTFTDYNRGFPKGIDNRKISKVVLTDQSLYAGTLFGLFKNEGDEWKKIPLPIKHQRITDVVVRPDILLVLSRSELLKLPLENLAHPQTIYIPTPDDYDNKTGIFKTLWVIHSGELLGISGKLLVDLMALIFIFLSTTGFIYYFSPGTIKRAKKKNRPISVKKRVYRFSVKWHNKTGLYTIVFLLITTFTGMFLRPPFLITIANSKVEKIPFTILDSPNPWYDQLRAIRYNEVVDAYLLSTSEGFYTWFHQTNRVVAIAPHPPVSIMGITVFEPLSDNEYLTGSFNGLFRWNLFNGKIVNYLTNTLYNPSLAPRMPIGDHMVSGYLEHQGNSYYFDYNRGVQLIQGNRPFPQMPDHIINDSPMSLWNLALEVHTGRIFQDLIGPFYILIVPVTGLLCLALLVSGFWIWWRYYRKKQKS